MALLPSPPPRVPLSFSKLLLVASFVEYGQHPYLSFSGYAVSLQARSCNEMGFPFSLNGPG